MGSMLVGSRDFVERARVERKMLGGGMTQAGIAAAAGLVALEESPKRLFIDHENARYLANALARLEGITLDPSKVVTNIVVFEHPDPAGVCGHLESRGVRAGAISPTTVRLVTHLDVDDRGIERAVSAIGSAP